MSRADLAGLQTWFQDEVVRPSLPEADSGAELEPAEAYILPSKTLTPAERVEIYADMHIARLVSVLGEDYSAVRTLVGEHDFDHHLARGYLADHPSHSFTLSVLGQHLPDWIARNEDIERRALITDVARLELAMTRVFDAPREIALTPAEIKALPADTWTDPRPRLIGALELLDLRHAANGIVRAVRQDLEMPTLEPHPTRVLVWRKDDVVWRRELEPAAFALLEALWRRASLAEAMVAAETAHASDAEDLGARVVRWMSEWAEDGLFAAIG
jgi:hypothetical protein